MLKDVATYWTGNQPLHYIHHICLASYIRNGHNVTLYTAPNMIDNIIVPEGVKIASVDTVMEGLSSKLVARQPCTCADLFRIILLKNKNVIWVDTDAYCVKPFPEGLDYIFATEAPEKLESSSAGNLNNGVFGLPQNSPALELLHQFALKSLGLITDVDPEVDAFIEKKAHPILKYGPRAVTHFLDLTGELIHQLPPSALYPVHFNLSDCFWDPLINVEDRFTEDTLSLHIWCSQVRPGWFRRRALKGSFMWKVAKLHNINMQKLARKK